ncbi:hypothetical protein Pelo_12571 [Pelomyxa schiedti]|nr:hypothetical protein Pelo_12571 [Pelomyxa schiedti]
MSDRKDSLPGRFYEACANGDIDTVKVLINEVLALQQQVPNLSKGGGVSAATPPTSSAVSLSDLVTSFRDPHTHNTPLHAAISSGSLPVVSAVLDAAVASSSGSSSSPLSVARQVANDSGPGFTPLLLACRTGKDNIVRHLITWGATCGCGGNLKPDSCMGLLVDTSQKDSSCCTAIFIACRDGNLSIVDILLSAVPHPFQHGNVAPQNHVDPYHITIKNIDGKTPLFVACQGLHIPVITRLLSTSQGTSTLWVPTNKGTTPIASAVLQKSTVLFDILYNACPDLPHQQLDELFHLACTSDSRDILLHLVQKYGVDINTLDSKGEHPLISAASNPQVVLDLLSLGAKLPENARATLLLQFPGCVSVDDYKKMFQFLNLSPSQATECLQQALLHNRRSLCQAVLDALKPAIHPSSLLVALRSGQPEMALDIWNTVIRAYEQSVKEARIFCSIKHQRLGRLSVFKALPCSLFIGVCQWVLEPTHHLSAFFYLPPPDTWRNIGFKCALCHKPRFTGAKYIRLHISHVETTALCSTCVHIPVEEDQSEFLNIPCCAPPPILCIRSLFYACVDYLVQEPKHHQRAFDSLVACRYSRMQMDGYGRTLWDTAKLLGQRHFNVSQFPRTDLHTAVLRSNLSDIQEASLDVDIEAKDGNGFTAYHYAAVRNDDVSKELLISLGATPTPFPTYCPEYITWLKQWRY